MSYPTEHIPIKSWAEDDRPREKLLIKGRAALSDAELIAILIGSGSRNESAVQLSQKILASINNNLNELGKLSVNDLMKFRGIGEAKAISIAAALELGRRRKGENPQHKTRINTSKDIFELVHPRLADIPHEEFWVIYLNRANSIIHQKNISVGGVTGTVVDVKLIMKTAVESLASSIILCHNHPSGNLRPSQADIDLTKNLVQAGAFLEIKVVDHVITGDNAYFSFCDEGMM